MEHLTPEQKFQIKLNLQQLEYEKQQIQNHIEQQRSLLDYIPERNGFVVFLLFWAIGWFVFLLTIKSIVS